MNLYTSEQVRAIELHAIQEVGISPEALMETAGRAVAAAAHEILGTVRGKRVLILAGKGNNGGDGLVAARTLHERGATVQVVLAGPISNPEGPAGRNLKAARALGIPVALFEEQPGRVVLPGITMPDLCIDALLGVGSSGAPRGSVGQLVEAANGLGCPVLSVDIPSGVDASTGQVPGACIQAAVTVAFGCAKLGLFCDPGIRYAGTVEIAEIGFPRASTDSVPTNAQALDAVSVCSWLPERSPWAHKGNSGTAIIVAGSVGMLGAAALCSSAALRIGAGLAHLIVPESMAVAANSLTHEVICHPAPQTASGHFSAAAVDAILQKSEGARALAIGPGIGTDQETQQMLHSLLPEVRIPVVIDADALNILSTRMDTLKKMQARAVLTPHPGEMARLIGQETAAVQKDRRESALRLAQEYSVITVLKGAATVIAGPEGELLLNTTGNGGMASAGMGDVLTGSIAGLLSQGMTPFEAAGAGVFLHGLAGDRCAARRGEVGLLASDLVHELPAALASVREGV